MADLNDLLVRGTSRLTGKTYVDDIEISGDITGTAIDSSPTSGSTNLVTSGGVYSAIAASGGGGGGGVSANIPVVDSDSGSTSTTITATITGLASYVDGLTVRIRSTVTSESGVTLNINSLGAKSIFNSETGAAITKGITTGSVFDYVYDSSLDGGDGGWLALFGNQATTNTIAYQIRHGTSSVTMANALYRYQLLFGMVDGTYMTATTTSNKTSATKNLLETAWTPEMPIYYYNYTGTVSAAGHPGYSYVWNYYNTVDLRYSFNSGSALTKNQPIYVKCTPQIDGTLKFARDSDPLNPITQTLPTTEDGYVYVRLGIANGTYRLDLDLVHPCFWYKNGALRLWSGSTPYSVPSTNGTYTLKATVNNGVVTYNWVAD